MSSIIGAIHIHSAYSHDAADSLDELRDFAIARGIGFLCLTDHAEDLSADAWDEYVAHCAAVSDARVRLIPGLEFRFAGFTGLHLLALGLSRWIEPSSPSDFVRLCTGAAAFTIVAHPILAGYRLPPEIRNGIDAVEVWNAGYNTRYLPDPRAITLLHALQRERSSVVGTAGLDQHDRSNDRQTRVLLSAPGLDPIEALRQGQFVNIGRTMRFGSSVPIKGLSFGALQAVRWVFDGVERAQDAAVRAIRGRSLR